MRSVRAWRKRGGLYAGLAHVNSPLAMQEAIRNLAVYHISAVRMNRVRGITFVKHVAFGWISTKTYYQLQKLHDFMPVAIEVIKGGYIMKAAIWTVTIPADVLATGTSIPLGVLVLFGAFTIAAVDSLTPGQDGFVMLDLLAPFLPFGELWLLYRMGADIWAFAHSPAGSIVSDLFISLGGPLQALIALWLSGGGPPGTLSGKPHKPLRGAAP